MLRFAELLVSTVILRPYVFVFLACYLTLAITRIGYKRTILFTITAYVIAFVCEWSSAVAATGFPFGLYYYIDSTRDRELWIAGVPFMDSLSFTFLSYVSWEMAMICLGRVKAGSGSAQSELNLKQRASVIILASFLMMYLDVIIDPVALRGERWFLGQIYYYPHGGIYFGVPIANFIGWFFVCLMVLVIYFLIERSIFGRRKEGKSVFRAVGSTQYQMLGVIGLYFGVLGFNLFMTFWIGERQLGLVGILLVLPLAVVVWIRLVRTKMAGSIDCLAR